MNIKLKAIDWRQKKLKPAMLERNPGRELWQPQDNLFNIRISKKDTGHAYQAQCPGFPSQKYDNVTDAMAYCEKCHEQKAGQYLRALLEEFDG